MKKYILLFIAGLLYTTTQSLAQEIQFSVGYGTYAMGDLKANQESLRYEYPIKPAVIENFPPFLYYDGSLLFPINHLFSLGGYYSFSSTGGRLSYQDQTGSILVDQVIKGSYVGVITSFRCVEKESFSFNVFAKEGLVFSNLKAVEVITVGDQVNEQNVTLTSTNATLDLGMNVKQRIIGKLSAYAALAYHVAITNNNLADGDDEYDLNADWGGARATIGVVYSFTK